MYCSKCGKEVNDEAAFCSYCGNRLKPNVEKHNSFHNIMENSGIKRIDLQKYKKYAIFGAFVMIIIVYFFSFRCKAGFCPLPSCTDGEYCSVHTCDQKGCYNKVAQGRDYCYTHMPATSETTKYNYIPELAEEVLNFSNIKINHNSSYTVCTATITNSGKKTYTLVEVKGKFENSSGTVLDTDWTYAVGSEGLEPGESTTLRLSVKKDRDIAKCELEILDYTKK
jgi:hypothetical protein